MKCTIISIILIFSTLANAAPKPPYIDSSGNIPILVISETAKRKVYLFGCSIDKTTVKYLGQSPICSQKATCSSGEKATDAIVENSMMEVTFNCSISSAKECKSKTWEKCGEDKSLPDELDDSCLSDTPGTIKPGCPNINPQDLPESSSKKRNPKTTE